MISGTHTVQVATSPEYLWDYLADFDNWAEFVVGFQKYRRVDERTSVWTLRGDVGVLAREVDLEVTLLEEEPGRRATYSITGVTERLEGSGTFEIAPVGASAAAADGDAPDATAPAVPPPPRPGWWRRFTRRLALRVLRRQRAKDARRKARSAAKETSPAVAPTAAPPPSEAAPKDTGDGAAALLTFSLEVTPGGPMAPMIEMLMRPLLEPSAEDFSMRIREQLEGRTA